MRCEECGTGFEQGHPRGRFCSPRCRRAAWQKRKLAEARREAREVALAEALTVLEEARARLAGREG